MLNYILMLVFLFVFPVILGKLLSDIFLKSESKWFWLLNGWIILFAIFEIVSVPLIFTKKTLDQLCICYSVALLIAFIILFIIKTMRRPEKRKNIPKKKWNGLEIIVMICAIGIIVFQVFFVVFKTHMDADDTFYIGNAVTSVKTNLMFQIDPYTGAELTELPMNYVFSPLPMFWAYISKVTGVHPAIIAHIFIPMIFIPMSYGVAYMIAKRILGDARLEISLFMVLYAVLQQYGYVSVYTASTFLLFRIWQGKAMLANVFLPCLLLLGDIALKKGSKKIQCIPLLFASLATCCCSSMGVILGGIEMALLVVVYFCSSKKVSVLCRGIMVCIPYVILGCAYVLIKL